jgi:hypothetical protein
MWALADLGDGAEVAIPAVLAPPALAKEAVRLCDLRHSRKLGFWKGRDVRKRGKFNLR